MSAHLVLHQGPLHGAGQEPGPDLHSAVQGPVRQTFVAPHHQRRVDQVGVVTHGLRPAASLDAALAADAVREHSVGRVEWADLEVVPDITREDARTRTLRQAASLHRLWPVRPIRFSLAPAICRTSDVLRLPAGPGSERSISRICSTG